MKCSYEKCDLDSMTKGYCNGHYMQLYRGYELKPLYNHVPLKDRIEKKTQKRDDGCWTWSGNFDTGGYPQLKYHGKTILVHRAYYKIMVRDIPSHDTLDHLCRNKTCINPDHLEPVSRSENVKRMQISKYYETEIERLTNFIKSLGYDPENLKEN